MAITTTVIRGVDNYYGLSSDTKPTAPAAGSVFVETNTGSEFNYSGSAWVSSSGDAVTSTAFSFLNIAAGQATTTVKSGAGTLHAIVFNGPATVTGTMIIYDNTAASGTVIARPLATAVVSPVTVVYDLAFATGLTIITAVANGSDMTVIYR